MVDATGKKKYIYSSENTGYNRVHVYDTSTLTYLGNVASTVNGKPLHHYAIPFRYEVWEHLDNLSGFDVMDASSITTQKAVAYRVASMGSYATGTVPPTSQHGKLLSENELGNYGFQTYVDQSQKGKYVTNGQLGAVNLNTKTLISVVNISRSTDAYPVSNIHTTDYIISSIFQFFYFLFVLSSSVCGYTWRRLG